MLLAQINGIVTKRTFWNGARVCDPQHVRKPGRLGLLPRACRHAVLRVTDPRSVAERPFYIDAIGNVGGFAGPYITGWLKLKYGGITLPFCVLGVGMLIAAGLAFLLPKTIPPVAASLPRVSAEEGAY